MASWTFPRLTVRQENKLDLNANELCTEVKRGIQFDLRLQDLGQLQSPSRVSLRYPWRWLWKAAHQYTYDVWMPEVT